MQVQLKCNSEGVDKKIAQARFNSYKQSTLTQLKRNKLEKRKQNSLFTNFERSMVQAKVNFGSTEYIQLASQYFPGFDPMPAEMQAKSAMPQINGSPALEHEADVMGKKAADGKLVRPAQTDTTQNIRREQENNVEGEKQNSGEKEQAKGEELIDGLEGKSPILKMISSKQYKTKYCSFSFELSEYDAKVEGESNPIPDDPKLKKQFLYASSEMFSNKIDLSLARGSTEVELMDGLKMEFILDAFKLSNEGDIDVATLTAKLNKTFEPNTLEGTEFGGFLKGIMNFGSRISLRLVVVATLNPKDVRRYNNFLRKKNDILAKEKRLSKLEQELKTLNADKKLSQNKYVQEGLEKVESTGKSKDSKKLINKLTDEHGKSSKNLKKQIIKKKKELRELEKSIRSTKSSALSLSKRIKSPLLKVANNSMVKKATALLSKIVKLADFAEVMLFLLKLFTTIAAGGKTTFLKGESIDQKTLYNTAELLMEVIHNAATDKVVPKGDNASSERPEAVPEALAKMIPENEVEETASELNGLGGKMESYSEQSGLDISALTGGGKGSRDKGEAENGELDESGVDAIGKSREALKGNAPKGSGGEKPDGRVQSGGKEEQEEGEGKTGLSNTGTLIDLPDKEEAIIEPSGKNNEGSFSVKEQYDESAADLETKDFGAERYLPNEEIKGATVNCHVYAAITDDMRGVEKLFIPLDVVARYENTLYTISFKRVSVKVDIGKFGGEAWHYIVIKENITAEGKLGRASLEKGKIYKIRPYVKNE